MSETISRQEMEIRRLAAAELFNQGWEQFKVARHFNVSRTTASRWQHAHQSGGTKALQRRKSPGRPAALPLERVKDLLRSPKYQSGKHTTATITSDIEFHLKVKYDQDHVGRILKRLGMYKSGRRWVWERP